MSNNKEKQVIKREALLDQLHGIIFAADMTYLPTEGCLDLQIMTSKGISHRWIGEEEWNVYKMHGLSKDRWNTIRKKMASDKLLLEDIDGTVLQTLLSCIGSEERFPDIIVHSKMMITEPLETIYAYFSTYEDQLFFYNDVTDLAKKLADEYSDIDTDWDEMGKEELEYWLSVYGDSGIPMYDLE